jgi:8-oxo-dGTP diphosphatase
MEMCAGANGFGALTGRVVARGTELPPGEYYPVVHVWIRDENGNYLVQQRALHLAEAPGVWGVTTGYIKAGENSVQAAMRETQEELGIRLSPPQVRLWGCFPHADLYQYIWLVEVSRPDLGTFTPGPDVAGWGWASKTELLSRASQGEFVAYSYLSAIIG